MGGTGVAWYINQCFRLYACCSVHNILPPTHPTVIVVAELGVSQRVCKLTPLQASIKGRLFVAPRSREL